MNFTIKLLVETHFAAHLGDERNKYRVLVAKLGHQSAERVHCYRAELRCVVQRSHQRMNYT